MPWPTGLHADEEDKRKWEEDEEEGGAEEEHGGGGREGWRQDRVSSAVGLTRERGARLKPITTIVVAATTTAVGGLEGARPIAGAALGVVGGAGIRAASVWPSDSGVAKARGTNYLPD